MEAAGKQDPYPHSQAWVSSALPKPPYPGAQKLKSWALQIGKRRKVFIHVLRGKCEGRDSKDKSKEKYRKVNL